MTPLPKKPKRPAHWLPHKSSNVYQLWHGQPLQRGKPRGVYLRKVKTPMIRLETTWDVDSVLSARDSHLKGLFQTSGLLWVWMLCTSRLKITVRKRVNALSAIPVTVEPAKNEPIQKAIAKLWESMWLTIMPESLRQGIQRQVIGMGASLCRVHWEDGPDGRWWPVFTLWPDDAFYYQDADKCWYARTNEGNDKKVRPGCGWFLWLPDGPRSFQLGAVTSLGVDCLLVSNSKSDWSNFNKSVSTIVKKVMVPRGAYPDTKDLFFDQVEAVGEGENTTVMCELNQDGSGFDFKYEAPDMGQVDTFQKSKEDAEKTITIEILGQEKTTDDGGVGTYDAVESLQGVEDRLILGDGEGLSTSLRAQVMMQWAEYNFGHPEWAPWVRWKPKKVNDAASKAKEDKELAGAALEIDKSLEGTDKQLDKVDYYKEAGFKLVDRPKVVTPMPPAQGREPLLPTS